MKITNETPVVIPPVETKTFPDLWIYGLNILCPTTTTGRVEITTLPYNYDTKEIYPGGHMTISTDDLWSAILEIPELQQAFGAIVMSIGPLRDWIKSKQLE